MEQRPPIETYRLEAEKYADGKIVIREFRHRETYDGNALDQVRVLQINPIAPRAFRLQKWQLTAAIVVPFLAALFIYWLNH